MLYSTSKTHNTISLQNTLLLLNSFIYFLQKVVATDNIFLDLWWGNFQRLSNHLNYSAEFNIHLSNNRIPDNVRLYPLEVKYWTGSEIKSGACSLPLSVFTFTVHVKPLQHFRRDDVGDNSKDGSTDNVDTLSLISDTGLCRRATNFVEITLSHDTIKLTMRKIARVKPVTRNDWRRYYEFCFDAKHQNIEM